MKIKVYRTRDAYGVNVDVHSDDGDSQIFAYLYVEEVQELIDNLCLALANDEFKSEMVV